MGNIKNLTSFFKAENLVQSNNVKQNKSAKNIKNEIIDFGCNMYNSLNKAVTGDISQECINAIQAAYEEIGISEDLDEKGEGHNTGEMLKYGGREGDAWCASFVSWLYGEGQDKESNDNTFGYKIAVSDIKKAAGEEYWGDVKDYSPKPGDIMIQKENGASHTGIVVFSDNNYIYTIEGNAGDAVRAKKYEKGGNEYQKISGYVKMNEWTKQDDSQDESLNLLSMNLASFENADKIAKKTI